MLQDTVTGLQMFHFHATKTVSAITWSKDGNIIAIGERGHLPGIAIWKRDAHITLWLLPRTVCPLLRKRILVPSEKYQRIAYLIGRHVWVECMAFDSGW